MDKSFMNHYTTTVKQTLDKYDKEIIHSIMIVRTPLQKAVDTIINMGSLGKSNKLKLNNDYDNLFHLNVLINGKYTLEKNEVINFVKKDTRTTESETMVVNPVPNNLSIEQLLKNTKKQQGSKYFRYSASSNNCQDFIKAMFISNGLNEVRYIDFIKQDTESIFKGNATLRKIANNVTDAAAIGNIAYSKANTTINKTVNNAKNTTKKTGRKIKKVFGGGEGEEMPDLNKMTVKELKAMVKANKKSYDRKVYITGLRKYELIRLLEELN